MKTDKNKDAAYYQSLPYTVIVRKDEEGDYVARIHELPGCVADGENEVEAIANLRTVQALWIDEALAGHVRIPEPEIEQLPSGKWLQRVPKKLHRQLINQAAKENISLNQLVASMLAEAVTERSCIRAFEGFLAAQHHGSLSYQFPYALWTNPAEIARHVSWDIPSRTELGELALGTARAKQLICSGFFVDKIDIDEHQTTTK
jgi:predicted RNase H-like HicB family nuclease